MFKGKSLSELAVELERQAKTKQDFKSPTSLMELAVVTPKHVDHLTNEARPLQFGDCRSVGDAPK